MLACLSEKTYLRGVVVGSDEAHSSKAATYVAQTLRGTYLVIARRVEPSPPSLARLSWKPALERSPPREGKGMLV